KQGLLFAFSVPIPRPSPQTCLAPPLAWNPTQPQPTPSTSQQDTLSRSAKRPTARRSTCTYALSYGIRPDLVSRVVCPIIIGTCPAPAPGSDSSAHPRRRTVRLSRTDLSSSATASNFAQPPPPTHPPPPDLMDEDTLDLPSLSPEPARAQTPPPRPPNPELLNLHAQAHARLTSELASVSHAMALDAERLRAYQTDLLGGDAGDPLRSAVGHAESNVAELRRKGDPPVDELVCSTSIVHNQLVDLVAEDNAIEDTVYHLHRALNAGRIDLDRFLRTTRELAQEQFMKRALIEKIQAGIPMGVSMSAGWA
ncbi:hypothetical protein EW146_g10377, partial [Bondarzewia mesenterica]